MGITAAKTPTTHNNNMKRLEFVFEMQKEATDCESSLSEQHTDSVCPFGFLLALAEKFADIFFLVDSGVSPQEFQQVRSVITRLFNQMRIGANAHHVGLAQYGRDVKSEFNLTTYNTKEEMQNAIKRFRLRRPQPTDPRNLGFALQHVSKYFFSSEAGGRADQGYRQYLIIFSGKESDDHVQREARRIKSAGVTVIGMSVGASLQGMHVVASQGQWYPSMNNAVQILKTIFEKQEVKDKPSSGKIFFYALCSLLIISAFQSYFKVNCVFHMCHWQQ